MAHPHRQSPEGSAAGARKPRGSGEQDDDGTTEDSLAAQAVPARPPPLSLAGCSRKAAGKETCGNLGAEERPRRLYVWRQEAESHGARGKGRRPGAAELVFRRQRQAERIASPPVRISWWCCCCCCCVCVSVCVLFQTHTRAPQRRGERE
jgi:hypothetical protein